MEHQSQQLLEYLAICQAMYERMERDRTWPWPTEKFDGDRQGDTVSPENNSPEPGTPQNIEVHTSTNSTAKTGVNHGKEANHDSTLAGDLVESEDNPQIV